MSTSLFRVLPWKRPRRAIDRSGKQPPTMNGLAEGARCSSKAFGGHVINLPSAVPRVLCAFLHQFIHRHCRKLRLPSAWYLGDSFVHQSNHQRTLRFHGLVQIRSLAEGQEFSTVSAVQCNGEHGTVDLRAMQIKTSFFSFFLTKLLQQASSRCIVRLLLPPGATGMMKSHI